MTKFPILLLRVSITDSVKRTFFERKRLFAPQQGGLGKQIGYSPRSGANNRSSCAIRPTAGRTREAVQVRIQDFLKGG